MENIGMNIKVLEISDYENEHNLPVPRLQIRNRKTGIDTMESVYSLIKPNVSGQLESVEMGKTKISVPGGRIDDRDELSLPFRDGAHIFYDMFYLKLKGFVVSEHSYKELSLTDETQVPLKLKALLKSN